MTGRTEKDAEISRDDSDFVLPFELQINAWIDAQTESVVGQPSEELDEWALGRRKHALTPHQRLFAEEPPNLKDWREVGWGLVLPEREDVSGKDKALAKDAPESIQRLLAARDGSPVFRYVPEFGTSHLRLYEKKTGRALKRAVSGGDEGTRAGEMPKYLLIVGSPAEIPWRLQYVLNPTYFVGRLDLDDDQLDSYVSALLDDWRDSSASRRSVVVWAVDRGSDDITWTMRYGLAEPLYKKFAADNDITTVVRLPSEDATHDNLVTALVDGRPGFVLTTSHGATPFRLGVDKLKNALGRPVDQSGTWLTDDKVGEWQPDGAIWYAHACCSAGSDNFSLYDGIAAPDSDVASVLTGVTIAGALTAPLPRYLLGCQRPLRAFVGHVEPTFNWTLRDPDTEQPLTATLRTALYTGLFQRVGEPIGMAMARHYQPIGSLWANWDSRRREADGGSASAVRLALAARLAALDRQSVVILGDPTVTIPQD